MKKILCLFLIIISVFSLSTVAFAVNENESTVMAVPSITFPEITIPEQVFPEEETTEPEVLSESETSIPEQTTEPTTESTTQVVINDTNIKPGYGYTVFFAENTNQPYTVTIKNKDTKDVFVLKFSEENGFVVTGYYPVGDYKIKKIEGSSNDIKFNDEKIKETNSKKFTIKETDYQSFTLSTESKKQSYFIGFIERQWWLALILVVLYVFYKRLQNSRALPSKER